MKNKNIPFCAFFAFLLCLCACLPLSFGQEARVVSHIGVLASRGKEKCLSQWIDTARHLSDRIAGASFDIIPLDQKEIYDAVNNESIDFLITDPAFYVELENVYGIEGIATLESFFVNKGYPFLGGVIFTQKNRKDLQGVSDLRKKTFMAVNEQMLGGWLATWRELAERKIDPYRDFEALSFAGTDDAVVYAVLDGKTDAGTVETQVLERMAAEGRIDLEKIKILNPCRETEHVLPFFHSTRIYPQWSFAKLKHVDTNFAKEVVRVLLDMPPDGMAAVVGRYDGWTIPSNYQSVQECMKELRVGLYKNYGKVTPDAILRQYWKWLLAMTMFLCLLSVAFTYSRALNASLRKSEGALEQSQRHLLDTINFSPDAFFAIDLEGKITIWNRALEEMTGFKAQDMLGKGDSEYAVAFFGEKKKTLIDLVLSPDEKIERSDLSMRREKDVLTGEDFSWGLKGREAYLWAKASPLYDIEGNVVGAMESVRDITEQKNAEEMLMRQLLLGSAISEVASRFVNVAFDKIDDEINVALKSIGTIMKVDRAYVFVFSDNSQKINNTHEWCADGIEPQIQNHKDITCDDELPWFAEKIRKQKSVNVFSVAQLPMEAAKEKAHFSRQSIQSLAVVPILFSREVIGFLGIDSVRKQSEWREDVLTSLRILAQVISSAWERQKAEARLREAYEQLKNTQSQLVQSAKMASVGQLAGGVAHEINNPLTGVLNNVQLIKMMIESKESLCIDDFKELLGVIEESAMRCKRITQSLLDFSRASKGVFVRASLNEIVEKVIALIEHELKSENIVIHKKLQPDLPGVLGDMQLLQQVVMDILVNARWAIKKRPGGGNITLQTCHDSKNKKVHLDIADDGVGIPAENLEQIFEPFFTTKPIGQGAGLGLSIVYNIIKVHHHGTIAAESELGKGTTFKVSLPACA